MKRKTASNCSLINTSVYANNEVKTKIFKLLNPNFISNLNLISEYKVIL